MTSIPSSASEAPRSIFSRLSIPLEAKATNISDFAINHDDPYRHYAPGDIVQGKVSFTALKAVHVTHLVLCLHGFVKIFKNNFGSEKKLSKKSTFPGTGRGKRGPEYFGNGFATIFEDECMICGERSFSRGRYNYGFAIAFPRRPLPSSISVSTPHGATHQYRFLSPCSLSAAGYPICSQLPSRAQLPYYQR